MFARTMKNDNDTMIPGYRPQKKNISVHVCAQREYVQVYMTVGTNRLLRFPKKEKLFGLQRRVIEKCVFQKQD